MSDETEPPSDPDLTDPLLPSLASPPDLTEKLRVLQESLTTIFREQVEQAGGAHTWLSSRCPRSRSSLGSDTNEDPERVKLLVLSETQAFWTGHEARLGECARCPEDGAACVETGERLPEGLQTRLVVTENTVVEQVRKCSRYADFRMARRLESAGVDKRVARVKLHDLSPEPEPNVIRAFDDFIGSGLGKRAPFERQIMIEGKQAREYAVALLRSTTRNYPNASYRSVNVSMLIRTAMNAMTVKEESPILELVEIEVLLLDGVERDSIQPDSYSRKELTWLYERRRDQGLATIITSTVPAKEAFPGVSVLRV